MDTAAPLTASARLRPCRCVRRHRPKVNRTHLHHIWPLGRGGPDVPENVIALCPTTHSEVHLIMEDFDRRRASRPRLRGESVYAYRLAVRGWEQVRRSRRSAVSPE